MTKHRELLLTKEQSATLDWKDINRQTFTIPLGKHYAYRMDWDVPQHEEAAFVSWMNMMTEAMDMGMTTINSLEDTDFACTPYTEEIIENSGQVTHIAILTDEQVKDIFG
jgi:hypothetical protein